MGMLRELQSQGLRTRQQALEYVGRMFRVKFALPDFYTDAQVAEYLLKCALIYCIVYIILIK